MSDLIARLRLEASSNLRAVAAEASAALDQVGEAATRTGSGLDSATSAADAGTAGLGGVSDAAAQAERSLAGLETASAQAADSLARTRDAADELDRRAAVAADVAGALGETLEAVSGGALSAATGLEAASAEAAALEGGLSAAGAAADLAAGGFGDAEGAAEALGEGLADAAEEGDDLDRSLGGLRLTALAVAAALGAAAVMGVRALIGDAAKAATQASGLDDTLKELRATAGQGFLDGALDGLGRLNAELGEGRMARLAYDVGAALGEAAAMAARAGAWVVENIDRIRIAAIALGGVALAPFFASAAAAAIAGSRALIANAVAMTATATAAGVARAALGGLTALVGGPLGAAFLIAGGAAWGLWEASSALRSEAEAHARAVGDQTARLDELERAAAAARGEIGGLSGVASDAEVAAAALTGEVNKLADAHWRAAAAAKAQALETARALLVDAQAEQVRTQGRYDRQLASQRSIAAGSLSAGARSGLSTDGGILGDEYGKARQRADASQAGRDNTDQAARVARIEAIVAEIEGRRLEEWKATPTGSVGGGSAPSNRIPDLLAAIEAAGAALETHALAAIKGEAALDAWRIAQAGADAVARAGSEATAAQAAEIRARAEAVERLAIADERIAEAATFARAADRDTAALVRRAEAAMGGREALEALRIAEAALGPLHVARVESLDQLTGLERESVALAMASAEARERQAIATEKAEAAGKSGQQLEDQIAAEERRIAAVGRGTAAEVAYARAEFVRSEVERAGLRITDEAAQAIIAKAEALFRYQALAEGAATADQAERELRLMRLSNREREIALRVETLTNQLLRERQELTEAEASAMADRRARAELEAEETAAAIGRISSSMRDAFVRDGRLAFDDLGDYAEERLRAAVYDALLARPLDIVINATVDIVNDLARQIFGGSAAKGFLGQISGALGGGLASLLGSAGFGAALGGAMGLGSGNGLVDAGLALGGSALGGMAGGAMGAYAAHSGLAVLAGSAAGPLAGLAGALAPIMGPLGALAGLALGSLLKDEKRPYTRADIVARGGSWVVDGVDAADGGSRDLAGQIGAAIVQSLNAASSLFGLDMARLEGLYTTAGYVTGGNYKALGGEGFFGGDIRGWIDYINQTGPDRKGNTLGAGVTFSQIGSAEELAVQVVRETILRAIAAGATDLSEAEIALVQATTSLEEAIALISAGRGFGERLDDLLLQMLDPAAFEKKKALEAVEATYQALRAEAQKLIDAGLLTVDVLARIEQLRDLQRDAALNGLSGAALSPFAEAKDRLQAWLDGLAVSDMAGGPRAQRDAAWEQYQRVLAQAQAGDRQALGDLATYADRLLRADRAATGSASQRQALYDQVVGEVRDLIERGWAEEPLTPSAISGPIVAALEASDTALADVLLTLPAETAAPLLAAILRDPDWAARLLGENVQVPPALAELAARVNAVAPDVALPIVAAVLAQPAWAEAMTRQTALTPAAVETVRLAVAGLPPALAGPIVAALSATPAWADAAVGYLTALNPSLDLLGQLLTGQPAAITGPIVQALAADPAWALAMLDQLAALDGDLPDIAGPIIAALAATPQWAGRAVELLAGMEPSLTRLGELLAGQPTEIAGPIVEALMRAPAWAEAMLTQLGSLGPGDLPDIAGPIIAALAATPEWGARAVEVLAGLEPSLDLLRQVLDGQPERVAGPILRALATTPAWADTAVDYLAGLEPSMGLVTAVLRGLPAEIAGPIIQALTADPAWAADMTALLGQLGGPMWGAAMRAAFGDGLTLSIETLGEVLARLMAFLSTAKPVGDDPDGPQINPGEDRPVRPRDPTTPEPPPVDPGLPGVGGGVGGGGGGAGDPFQPPVIDADYWMTDWMARRSVILDHMRWSMDTVAGPQAAPATASIEALSKAVTQKLDGLQKTLADALAELADTTAAGLEQVAGGGVAQVEALRELAGAQRVANAHMIAKAA